MKKILLRLDFYLVLLIICLSFLLRLYKVDSPLADWHSWRQTDTAGVSRYFVQNGYDILHPKFNDISNVPSGLDNPNGYRFVEFPIYNVIHAATYQIFDNFSIETWGRLLTAFFSTISVLFIYLIVKKYADVITALFSAFFFAILPYNIFFGRSILPDSSMVTAILGGIYFFSNWIENIKNEKTNDRNNEFSSWCNYILAILFTISAILLKPYAIFYTLPMIFLALKVFKLQIFRQWKLWFFALLTIAPLILWRMWMSQFPEGIPVNDWLFNAGSIRFKGAFFYWLFADRLGRLILGYWGISLFVLGVLVNSGKTQLAKSGVFFYTFLISSLLYLTVMARGNVQHDYYQILIIPSVTIFMGFGARALFFPHTDFINKFVSRLMLIIIILFTAGFGWYFVRDFYNINNQSIIIAGNAADKILPKNAKVIAPYDGDTTLLYHINRQGWASFQNSLPELIEKGATHLVLINPKEHDLEFQKEYKLLAKTKEYVIYDLKSKK